MMRFAPEAYRRGSQADMTFKRFLIWLLEKLIELHLAVVVLLCVKWLLPSDVASFTSWAAFATGVQDAFHTNLDDALYMVGNFMGGDWGQYVWHTYRAAVWMTGVYFYAASLYTLTSLFACLLSRTYYVRLAVAAYLVSSVICTLSFWRAWDAGNARLGAALFIGGLVVVMISALIGKGVGADKKTARRAAVKSGRRIELSA